MFDRAAKVKKEMDDLEATTNVCGFGRDGVHLYSPIDEFIQKAIDEGLQFGIITRNSDDFPFELALFYNGVRFYCLCTFKRSEEHTSELQSRFDLVCR